jgi:hypothetical protein
MTSRDFVYWIQGYFEISKAKALDEDQVDEIKKHLALVFKHEIDPSYGNKAHQDALNAIHSAPHGGSGNTLYRC